MTFRPREITEILVHKVRIDLAAIHKVAGKVALVDDVCPSIALKNCDVKNTD